MQNSLLAEIIETPLAQRRGELGNVPNPMPKLYQEGWAQGTGNGLFVLSGPLVSLLQVIDRSFLKLAQNIGAIEYHVPSMLSPENAKASAYAESFRDQALLVHSSPQGEMLSPTVCYHLFSAWKKCETISPHLATAVGICSRHEKESLSDLSRLRSFTLREIVGIGSKTQCETWLTTIKRETLALLNSEFDLSYDITLATDPFFADPNDLKKKAQLIRGAKEEVRALLPFADKTSAIISFNRHGMIFNERFGLEHCPPYSFCVGFGYERILFAILSQKGTNFENNYYGNLLK